MGELEPGPLLTFHTHLPWPLLCLQIASAALAAAWWAYPRTSGKGGSRIRILLALLRSSAAILLVLVAAGLEVIVVRTLTRPPRLGILVDSSRSMAAPAARAQLDSLARVLPASLPGGFRLETRRFADGHGEASLPSVLTREGSGPRSDAAPALEAMTRRWRAPDRVILVTDGHWTGASPSPPGEGVRTDVILVGPRNEPEGVRIARVRVPDRVWPGEPSGVEVSLVSSGLEDRPVRIALIGEGGTLSDTTLVLGGTGVQRDVILPFTLPEPGTTVFTVRLEGPGGTQERAAVVEGEGARRRVLILAARPLPAAGAIRRALDADPRMHVDAMVRLQPDRWPPLPAMSDSADAYVVVDSAPDELPSSVRSRVEERVRSGAAGLLVLGPGPSPSAWESGGLAGCLPLRLEGAGAVPGPWAVRSDPDGAGSSGVVPPGLDTLPAVEQVVRAAAGERGRVLLQGVRQDRALPLLALRTDTCRVAMVMTGAAWRWEQLRLGSGQDPAPVRRMWQDLVHVLASGRAWGLEAAPREAVVSAAEPIGLRARLSDAGGRPVPGARIRGRLMLPSGEAAAETGLDPVPGVPGSYQGSFRAQPPGTYRWEVEAEREARSLGRAGGRLAVDPWDPEEHTGRADRRRAAALAASAGGRVLDPREVTEFLAGMEAGPVRETARTSLRAWPAPWTLLLALFLLALEWTLRRRHGMI